MKSVLSLILTSVFFISQSFALAGGTEAQGTNSLFSSKDLRLKLADEMEAKGEYLQRMADLYGEEAAAREFDRMTYQNLSVFFAKSKEVVTKMTEAEAQTQLMKVENSLASKSEELGDADVERIASIISDRTLSAKEKMTRINESQTAEHFRGDIDQIKSQISLSGYQKTFSDLASQVRSRTHDDTYSSGDDAFLVVVLILFILLIVVAAATAEPTYYYVAGGCGGYGYYSYHPHSSYPYNSNSHGSTHHYHR